MNTHNDTPTTPETEAAPAAGTVLSARAEQVLADVVESYGSSGEPVGSKMLVESGRYQLSGASIRNVMQDLESLGLLMHPHTSAGRIPTEKGFRYYAQQLVQTLEPDEAVKQALRDQIHMNKNMTQLTRDVTSTLSSLTNCAAMVSVPKADHDPLETMEFVRLSGDKVLVVMVTKGGEIENRVIEVPAFVGAEDLAKAAQTLRPVIMGQTIDQARTAMIGALAEQKLQVNAMIDQMMAAANEWGQPVTADGAMVVAGSTNLFQYPELVRDKLQGLVKMFEEKRLLMALVEEVRGSDGVKIFVGGDVPVVGGEDMAVVATPFGKTETGMKLVGSLGVIGPMRMDYKRTLGVVDYTGKLLSKVLSEK